MRNVLDKTFAMLRRTANRRVYSSHDPYFGEIFSEKKYEKQWYGFQFSNRPHTQAVCADDT